MPPLEQLQAQLYRLVYLSRAACLKRAIESVNAEPQLNFWRIILGSQFDVAVLEWCKVFGAHGEETHWKKLVPAAEHSAYKAALLSELGCSNDQWTSYWEHMKSYRDSLVAHHIDGHQVATYPDLTLALASAAYHYLYLLPLIRLVDGARYPDDLAAYQMDFQALATQVAAAALDATKGIPESVR